MCITLWFRVRLEHGENKLLDKFSTIHHIFCNTLKILSILFLGFPCLKHQFVTLNVFRYVNKVSRKSFKNFGWRSGLFFDFNVVSLWDNDGSRRLLSAISNVARRLSTVIGSVPCRDVNFHPVLIFSHRWGALGLLPLVWPYSRCLMIHANIFTK